MEVLVLEVSSQLSKEVLKATVIGGMVAAVALPSALATATGVIDDPYQLISFRSEKAGVELAHCLLESDEHRPVSLVGFSFGARVVFSCLLELVRHQAVWEEQRQPPPTSPRKDVSMREPKEGGEEENSNDNDDEATKPKNESWASRRFRQDSKKEEAPIVYKREPASIIEDVVLIGLPMLIDRKEWISSRGWSVVV
jgi:hypothetical protein